MSGFRAWLIQTLGGTVQTCNHEWRILIEHYPSYTKDYWQCTRCPVAKVFEHDKPPVPIQTEICNLGGIHIVNGRKLPSAQMKGVGGKQARKVSTGRKRAKAVTER